MQESLTCNFSPEMDTENINDVVDIGKEV